MPRGCGTWRSADQPTRCAAVRLVASCLLAARLCCRRPWRHGRLAMLTLAHSNLVASTTGRACVCVIARGDDVHVNVACEKAHRDCFHGNPLSIHHRATLAGWWCRSRVCQLVRNSLRGGSSTIKPLRCQPRLARGMWGLPGARRSGGFEEGGVRRHPADTKKPRRFHVRASGNSGRAGPSLSAAPATCMSGLAARPRFAARQTVFRLCHRRWQF